MPVLAGRKARHGGCSPIGEQASKEDYAVTLRSVYVGAGGRTGGHAVHVTHTPQGRRIRHRVLVDVPVTHARERCLSDHARCVQSTLARQSGAVVAVQISDELAALAATVYPPPP